MNAVDELNLLLGIGPSRPQLPLTLRKSGYLAVRSLGKGSYGQAFLVYHEPKKQYFVVKHLNLAGMSSAQRHNAHNEINILQKLHHPNIVRYVEYYEEHPHLYIVMEYADGGDVYSLLSSAQTARKMRAASGHRGDSAAPPINLGASPRFTTTAGLLSEAQVVSLFVQTTMAVKYMHDRRLLHRDIKSSNIFLTKNHVVKLGDFGISTVLQSTVAMASTMCGTPCYFSPELCQGRPYNSKSDMWALGVLLYELCAGHVPFESTSMKALMRDIVHKQPPRIPAVYSEELWELVVRLLQKDARRRPDAGQVLMSPVLMRHVPDLIQQLADDTENGGAPAVDRMDSAFKHDGPQASAHLTPPPPPPPPRRGQQALPSSSEASGRSGGASLSPTTAAAAGGAGAGAGASSILQLLARFDAQKQHIAEARQRRREIQEGSQGAPTTCGVTNGSRAEGPARLSPGAAAALRQQGLKMHGAERADGGAHRHSLGGGAPSSVAAAAAPSRAVFMPPPIPASLRDAAAVDQRRPAALPTTSSPSLRGHEGVSAVQAPKVTSSNPTPQQGSNGHAGVAAAQAQPSPVRTQRQRCSDPLRNDPASPLAASGALPAAGELSAVLSELSSWQERSARRQLRHSGHRIPRNDASGKSESEVMLRFDSLKGSAHVSSLEPPRSAASDKEQPTLGKNVTDPSPPGPAEAVAVHEAKGGKAATRDEQLTIGGDVGQMGKSADTADRGKPIVGALVVSSGVKTRVSSGSGSGDDEKDDNDDDESATLSFVDALGTALDVDAVQAASAAAQRQQLRGPSSQPLPSASLERTNAAFSLSGRAPLLQESIRKALQGTSDRLDTVHTTMTASTIFNHNPLGTAVMRGTMCGASVSVEVDENTGATHGVEWLHLPEAVHGLTTLLSLPAPSDAPAGNPTNRGPSAGTGAVAAVVLRAQAGGTPQDHSLDRGAVVKGKGSCSVSCTPISRSAQSPRVASLCSSTEISAQAGDVAAAALGQANIRAYVHRSQAASSLQVEGDGHQAASHPLGSKPTTGNDGVAAAERSAVWIIYTCLTCGALVGMQHDGVEGLLLPMATLDAQSLDVLSSCAQELDLSATESGKAG